jgi:hypothetical protein
MPRGSNLRREPKRAVRNARYEAIRPETLGAAGPTVSLITGEVFQPPADYYPSRRGFKRRRKPPADAATTD